LNKIFTKRIGRIANALCANEKLFDKGRIPNQENQILGSK
jgi:hypothetical protein